MNLNSIRQERQKWLKWKNIAPIKEAVDALIEPNIINVSFDEAINVELDLSYEKNNSKSIEECAKLMLPWRKGPFKVGSLFIDSEWKSNIKYSIIEPHFNLKDKIVADIGCNNGYYMFKMLEQKPKKVVGFDPSALCYMQFEFINKFVKSDIKYEMLGIEHVEFYEHKFDTLFCLGKMISV